MHHPTIAFIGAGNMAHCIIDGLINNGYPKDNIWASNPNVEILQRLREAFDIQVTQDNAEAALAAEVVVLAVKPDKIRLAISTLKMHEHKALPLFISIAAGITTDMIQHCLPQAAPIIRAMPNTPAQLGTGATALFANLHASEKQREMAESIFRAVGLVAWLGDEAQMNTVTALSGSGPAYFFLFMEALEQSAEQLGLPADVAHLLTLQTALGAARMAFESGKSLMELERQVTSPGGTTEKALATFNEHHFRSIVHHALQAAKKRSEELSTTKEEK